MYHKVINRTVQQSRNLDPGVRCVESDGRHEGAGWNLTEVQRPVVVFERGMAARMCCPESDNTAAASGKGIEGGNFTAVPGGFRKRRHRAGRSRFSLTPLVHIPRDR